MAGKTNLQIFVPARLNDGTIAPPGAREDAERTLCHFGGGVTVTNAWGVWIDPATGQRHNDRIEIIETDADGSRSFLTSQLTALAVRVAVALGQKSVYIRVRETDARLVIPVDSDR